jgi:hypothetical protein
MSADGSSKSPFARIRRAYAAAAILSFNSVLLLIIVLFALHLALNVFEWYRGPTEVYAPNFDLSAYVEVDEETAREIVREFDLHAAGGHNFEGIGEYDYQPWVEFAERPFAGKYLNVEERAGYTVRRTAEPEPAAGREDFVVWAFGGSTMFGFGMNDEHTIPSHLQREVQKLRPDRRVVVVNHAHGWWYSSQEVAHFLALLRLEPAPDAAVFLDGYNDVGIMGLGYEPTYYTPVLWDAWEAERRRRQYPAPGGRWFRFTQSFPTIRLHRILRPPSSSPPAVPDRFSGAPQERVERIGDVYRKNRRLGASIAREFGIQPHFFLQPVFERQSLIPIFRRVYPAQISEARSDSSHLFVSLHDAIDGLKKPYLDGCHYNEEASQVLACRMAEYIAGQRPGGGSACTAEGRSLLNAPPKRSQAPAN